LVGVEKGSIGVMFPQQLRAISARCNALKMRFGSAAAKPQFLVARRPDKIAQNLAEVQKTRIGFC
jgi:hypothetical protein